MPDNTFASGILGDGFAIMPTDGTIHAPVDGTVTALYSSKHAIGITGPVMPFCPDRGFGGRVDGFPQPHTHEGVIYDNHNSKAERRK